MRFLVGIILARILGPGPFGEVALAILLIGLGNLVADLGFGTLLVRSQDVGPDDIRVAFTAQVSVGVCLTLASFFLAGAVADALHSPSTTTVLRAMSPIFLSSALGQTSAALLRRSLRTQALQKIQISTYLITFIGIAIPMAVLGFGVWSLVVAQLIQSFASSLFMFLQVRHPLGVNYNKLDRVMLKACGRLTGSNILDWIITNVDTVMVGRNFSSLELGLYNRSYFLTFTLANTVASSLKSVVLPVFARIQSKQDLLRKAYISVTVLVAFAIMPLFFCIALVPRTLIEGVYGPAWSGAVPFVPPLSIAMPFLVLASVASPTLWAVGRIENEFNVQIVAGSSAVVLFAIAASHSIVAVAWTVAVIYAVRYLLVSLALGRVMQIGMVASIVCLRGPLIVALTAAAITSKLDGAIAAIGLPSIIRFGVDTSACYLIALAVLVMFPDRVLGADGVWGLSKLMSHVPFSGALMPRLLLRSVQS